MLESKVMAFADTIEADVQESTVPLDSPAARTQAALRLVEKWLSEPPSPEDEKVEAMLASLSVNRATLHETVSPLAGVVAESTALTARVAAELVVLTTRVMALERAESRRAVRESPRGGKR